MDLIDVPATVITSPDDKNGGIKFADALLTSLLSLEQGSLQAEFEPSPSDRNEIVWKLKKFGEEASVLIATSTDIGKFRHILARFGHHYMGGQLYNGYVQKFLSQCGHTHRCHIYMFNCGETGFWIRVYAFKID